MKHRRIRNETQKNKKDLKQKNKTFYITESENTTYTGKNLSLVLCRESFILYYVFYMI